MPSKTWFFTIFTFLAFLTHPNNQKMFWRARSQFFKVLKHQNNFCQNWGTLGPKVFCLAWIQSLDMCNKLGYKYIEDANMTGAEDQVVILFNTNLVRPEFITRCINMLIMVGHYRWIYEYNTSKIFDADITGGFNLICSQPLIITMIDVKSYYILHVNMKQNLSIKWNGKNIQLSFLIFVHWLLTAHSTSLYCIYECKSDEIIL